MLAWLEDEIDEDRRTLDSIMNGLDIDQSTLKTALSVVAERAGRLKLNGHLWKRSPLSSVVELEALAAAVCMKRNLWRSLAALAEQSAVGDAGRLPELIDRATLQLERVQAHHDDAARHAFNATATQKVGIQRPTETTTRQVSARTDGTLAPDPRDDGIDQILEDAEGGVEGSLLDSPVDADGTPI